MSSDVEIANLALTKLGQTPINSFTDNTTRAAAINRSYAMFRDKLLRVFKWNFNRAYAKLAVSTTAPLFEYPYAYQLPTDCLRLDNVSIGVPSTTTASNGYTGIGMPGLNLADFSFDRSQDYRVVGKMIYTWVAPPLNIVYGARITDPNMFDGAFVESFATYLAWQLCEEITSSTAKKESLGKEYENSMREARMTNAIDLPPETIPDDSLMASRLLT